MIESQGFRLPREFLLALAACVLIQVGAGVQNASHLFTARCVGIVLDDRFDRSRDAWQDQYFKDRPDWTVDPLDRLNPPKDDPFRK